MQRLLWPCWIKFGPKKFPVLCVVDLATKLQEAMLTKSETSLDFRRALERGWFKLFGISRKFKHMKDVGGARTIGWNFSLSWMPSAPSILVKPTLEWVLWNAAISFFFRWWFSQRGWDAELQTPYWQPQLWKGPCPSNFGQIGSGTSWLRSTTAQSVAAKICWSESTTATWTAVLLLSVMLALLTLSSLDGLDLLESFSVKTMILASLLSIGSGIDPRRWVQDSGSVLVHSMIIPEGNVYGSRRYNSSRFHSNYEEAI